MCIHQHCYLPRFAVYPALQSRQATEPPCSLMRRWNPNLSPNRVCTNIQPLSIHSHDSSTRTADQLHRFRNSRPQVRDRNISPFSKSLMLVDFPFSTPICGILIPHLSLLRLYTFLTATCARSVAFNIAVGSSHNVLGQ